MQPNPARLWSAPRRREAPARRRRGIVAVLAAFVLVVLFAFVAFAVDTGRITMTQTELQNAADAASLAASQEITTAVSAAGAEGETIAITSGSEAVAHARLVAKKVAAANGVYIDPNRDVAFGSRKYDAGSGKWTIAWDQAPYNTVKVTARRDNPDTSQGDGALRLAFGWAVGRPTVNLSSSATAFVESRDLVVVLDYSASMSDDSEFKAIGKLGKTAVENNLREIFLALGPPKVGTMATDPQWMTLVGPAPSNASGAQVSVTFRDPGVYVVSTKTIVSVKAQFSDGTQQTFSSNLGTSAEIAGTGSNKSKLITTVWVESGQTASSDPVTVTGTGTNPKIQVTFKGTSIDVTSTKDLSNVVLEFSDGVQYKFDGLTGKTGSFAGIGSNAGKTVVKAWIKSGNNSSGDGPGYGERFTNPSSSQASQSVTQRFDDTNDNVKAAFGLAGLAYPYPSGSWDEFINFCRTDSDLRNAGYGRKFGGMTFANYLLKKQYHNHQTPDLWKTPHYPFHAVKNGTSLFLKFLAEMDFGDEVGLVTYDDAARVEQKLSQGDVQVDLTDDPITDDYDALDTIQRRKQSGHYGTYTAMGYGVKEARKLLFGGDGAAGHTRGGAHPTIVLMTDGLANRYPKNWSLPGDFSWATWTDYDDDGDADYTTSDKAKQYAFYEAVEAIKAGATIHTLCVGADADRDLMAAIAFAGGGVAIVVPGGLTIEQLEAELLEAFAQIASKVPPAKLIYDLGASE